MLIAQNDTRELIEYLYHGGDDAIFCQALKSNKADILHKSRICKIDSFLFLKLPFEILGFDKKSHTNANGKCCRCHRLLAYKGETEFYRKHMLRRAKHNVYAQAA